jgi:uncharacterized membrane protein YkvA (DUF1232 family)
METHTASKATEIIERAKILFGKQVDMLVRQEQKIVELIQNVGTKLGNLASNSKVKKLAEPVQVFIRMIRAHIKGTHKMSLSTLGMIVLAMVYFLSPIDFIPDFLGIIGFADDLSVVLAVYAKVKDEVDAFLEWERTQA